MLDFSAATENLSVKGTPKSSSVSGQAVLEKQLPSVKFHSDLTLQQSSDLFPLELGHLVVCNLGTVRCPSTLNAFVYSRLDKGSTSVGLRINGLCVQ